MNRGQIRNILRGWIILLLLLGPAGISQATAPEQNKTQTEWVTGGRKNEGHQLFSIRLSSRTRFDNTWQQAISFLDHSVQVQYHSWYRKELIFSIRPPSLSRIFPKAEPNPDPAFIS